MRGNRYRLVLIVMVAVFMKLDVSALAIDDMQTRATLRGLEALYVQVEHFDPELKKELKKGGLTESLLQTRIERRLEVAGIKVLSGEEFQRSDFTSILYLNARILMPEILKKYTYTVEGERVPKGGPTERYLYTIDVELRQPVSLLRNPVVKGLATTWSTGSLGFGRLSGIQMDVADQVDTFVNAYLSVKSK